MADLTLKINANFEAAKKAFEDMGEVSESTKKKFEKFAEGFKTEQVDKFIEKQKICGAAILAVKGDLAAAEAGQKAYGTEIQRLIKNGVDPESEAIKRLKAEYTQLGQSIETAKTKQEAMEKAVKGAEVALKATAAIAAAFGTAMIAGTQAMAAAGDAAAKTAKITGQTAEQW
ncbi:hypothetical protein [Leadbettera azotonutricia]|uniref:hypothetical protein n=1 Tax=Leadbettera azotonutricia TaxID=150829 RepID=UPI00031C2331|nr:hypothetical protein [Leadbettera azotonutricia]